MRNAAEPARAADEPVKSARTPARGKASTPSRPRSEAATLVCAIAVAVFMGVACGAWINARLASAASPVPAAFLVPPAPAHLLPAAPAVETPPAHTDDAETGSEISEGAEVAADEDTSANAADETSEALSRRPSAPADKELERPAAVPDRPSAGAVSPSTKTRGEIPTAEVAKAKPKAVRGQGSPLPCAMYASADSLNIRGGGAATLVVGGPGEAGRVTVTTPDWSNIAVFSEGRTGGGGWFRYSVRSVGKKSGVYSVRFTTPCGSRNIRVTVVQP
jgi:hypothetical protein